jgi:DeoR/GlpR family transcriptional regulator of sugar metabolism
LQAVAATARLSILTQQPGVRHDHKTDPEVPKDGLVKRPRWRCAARAHNAHEPSLEDRLVLERPEKSSIARAAASLVRPGTAIAIAAGSTTFSLAQCLLDVPGLTIVTNSLRVANLYTGNRGPDGTSVLVTGGMRATSDALVGPVADLTIR